ncbi:MAG: DNA gyrase inhibitor YacG [Thermodesulfovibrionales bacterium]|nr:DNA gyrase inhibitor YacG [Thermodesulfovibrionales bacterium]
MNIICPVCRIVTTWNENPWRPFCSERCKLIDLGRWASEEYRISVPVEPEQKISGEEEQQTEIEK